MYFVPANEGVLVALLDYLGDIDVKILSMHLILFFFYLFPMLYDTSTIVVPVLQLVSLSILHIHQGFDLAYEIKISMPSHAPLKLVLFQN